MSVQFTAVNKPWSCVHTKRGAVWRRVASHVAATCRTTEEQVQRSSTIVHAMNLYTMRKIGQTSLNRSDFCCYYLQITDMHSKMTLCPGHFHHAANLAMFGHEVSEIYSRTDKQTHSWKDSSSPSNINKRLERISIADWNGIRGLLTTLASR